MFSLIVALAMYLTLSPLRPAISVADYLPSANARTLPLAAVVPRQAVPRAPVKKDPARLGVETTARAAVAVDWKTGAALFEKNADEPMAIASVTKLMTAIVVLSNHPTWKREIEMLGADQRTGNIPQLIPGEIVTVEDLFGMSLVASSNEATTALARSTGLTNDEFVAKMNEAAVKIGMTQSTFVESTGLDSGNKASARDVALLIRHAFTYPEIQAAAKRREYSFVAKTGMAHAARATDELLGSFLDQAPYRLLGGKTGFIQEAGYCFGAAAENGSGDRVIAVVLGADSRELRFKEVKSLIYWSFDAYEWPKSLSQR